MFEGLRTVIYRVPDLARAKAWYAAAFGVAPYFDEPFYVGFDIGGYELGLLPDESGLRVGNNVLTYWGVPAIGLAYERLIQHGAVPDEPIKDVGEGIKVATVADPFGNIIGLLENPHFRLPAA